MRHHRSQRSTRRFVLSQHARIGAAVTTSTTKQIMVFIRQQTDEIVVNFALFCGFIAHNLPIQPCFNLDLLLSDLSSLNRPLTHSLSPSPLPPIFHLLPSFYSTHSPPVIISKASRYFFAVSSTTSSGILTPSFPFNPDLVSQSRRYCLS